MATRVCVVGTGYVGMACCIGLSMLGHRVHGFDIMVDRIDRLRCGIAPYQESNIDTLLREQVAAGELSFSHSIYDAARDAEVVLVAVGTPARADGSADLSALHGAMKMLSSVDFIKRPTIVIRSTVPPGTSDELAESCEAWAEIAFAPEFLREGSAIVDFLDPDRIVVGAESDDAANRYAALFASLEKPVLRTTRSNAEMIKCWSNAFLALKISFVNEVANLCDAVGATADDVLHGMGYDRHIGKEFLMPGIGFGGTCFEKDVKSMQHTSELQGVDSQLFSATLRVNERQPMLIVEKLEASLGDLADVRIGVWGLTFKAGTSDTRDPLATLIVDELAARGATTVIYDPAIHVAPLPQRSHLVRSALEAAECDALVVLTDWPEFRTVEIAEVATRVRRRVVIDGRNMLDGARLADLGIHYRGVRRPMHAKRVSIALSQAI
jgi:UDPglucose 6-dehydrogenase